MRGDAHSWIKQEHPFSQPNPVQCALAVTQEQLRYNNDQALSNWVERQREAKKLTRRIERCLWILFVLQC